MNVEDIIPTQGELEQLFVNNDDLKSLEAYLNRFNPIRTMRMDRMEIRHSAILAWLLDPSETHGLGDQFLRTFLCEAMRGQSERGSPTAMEILQADLSDAEIRRERQNIDILILLPRLNWAFIIENKFYSIQHEGQLAKYAERVKSLFEFQGEDFKVRGIFLTLLDEEAEDDRYVSLRYSNICEFLPKLMTQKAALISDEVKIFLKHYLEIIMEETGMSEEHIRMEALARRLYQNHKKVLNFVMDYGATTDFVMAMKEVFGAAEYGDFVSVDDQEFMFNGHNAYQVSFLPKKWVEALGGDSSRWEGCNSWWAGYPLICWLHLYESSDAKSGTLRLFAEVGPISEHKIREALITRIQQSAEQENLSRIRFQRGAADEGKRYSKFLKDNSVAIGDIHNAEEIEKAMKVLIKRFVPVFDALEKILPDFKKYGASASI